MKARRDDLRNIWRELSENGPVSSRPFFDVIRPMPRSSQVQFGGIRVSWSFGGAYPEAA
jgi:hypothetical protein